jgi:chloramphenicol 3-O-phosphotransferase
VGQVRCKVQISAKPGCAYGLQLMTAPPWVPVGVVVVMSLVFPTRLDPSAFCGVLVEAASGLPKRWGPNVLAVVSI